MAKVTRRVFPKRGRSGPDSPTNDANVEERLVQIQGILTRLERLYAETARTLAASQVASLETKKTRPKRKKR